MEPGDGELAAKREKPYAGGGGGGEDRLSALPDDILVQILLRVETRAAGANSGASSRSSISVLKPTATASAPPSPPTKRLPSDVSSSSPRIPTLAPWRNGSPSPPAAPPEICYC
ncbi:hypothetical protein E2562_007404 [Oryza meyeriana var. granulata]|uniref:F-box domain-containing protein n=1 Tax=Oryza meyeriana var. granulata TaxID=110450 RepID=A0A6G1CZR1_9ORYZ|nr:hypothetical protein E2562_007404 [Oryza meyeriana var. granulata]KAF0905619.1 hypothetical protein E2562_007404 [Oryza meyeriana var. granulata]